MADESYSFSTARTRLEEIVAQVRKKDTSLEKSLDLLEEGVRLANACTELIDHQDWVGPADAEQSEGGADGEPDGSQQFAEAIVVEGVAVIDDVVVRDVEGNIVAEVVEVREFDVTDAADGGDDAWAEDSPAGIGDDADDPSATER